MSSNQQGVENNTKQNLSSERFAVNISNHVGTVVLNRPKKMNVMDKPFFSEFYQAIHRLNESDDVYVIVLKSTPVDQCPHFSAGLDLKSVASDIMPSASDDESSPAVANLKLSKLINEMQQAFRILETCKKPVIAAINGMCIGGAIDMILAADFRVCTKDAIFSIRETAVGITADLGTLNRIHRVVGKGFAREMAFTAADVKADRAYHFGLVNQVFDSQKEMFEAVDKMAKTIASHSPLIVQSTKHIMNHAEEHSIEDGLAYVKLWNSAFLKSDDLTEAFMSFMEKRRPKFKNKL
ncbi:enoyl-CoA hydratase-like protein [Naegleria gruberi]|uniref:Enoyl-CoA hydratase-like protein n=1 Tax=Naegleria gruberi TaxID=5762 RepID=D2VM20_NAEGR|nr:enoyl-CoA hydratase-like protein [Naegleria gruberi]EFC42149.1 enoyl-CoA hydratase-like protein [Naegleria gruberi]|eukprot:XP_002674893.1 enoyl-CoA hydratase-like protein [Naegleria gruberi strain NEG-M]